MSSTNNTPSLMMLEEKCPVVDGDDQNHEQFLSFPVSPFSTSTTSSVKSHSSTTISQSTMMHDSVKPGEFVMRHMFQEFTQLADKKIDNILSNEPLEKGLSKCLQRGEDGVFDGLMTALGSVAEHCLPSLLRILFQWRERQLAVTAEFISAKMNKVVVYDSQSKASGKAAVEAAEKAEQIYLLEKRDLAIEFVFCLVLVEVLKQLCLHPGHENLVGYIENLAFKHFRFRESAQTDPNLQNMNMIADLYAEVMGVMVMSRFKSVKGRFISELKELRSKEGSSPLVTHQIICLLMGMKFFRVKMVPIEEFEASFLFMQECATYFLEVKDKDIKHALAGLFVEILVPVAAVVKNEVNVPCVKNFVELLYPATLDLCTKKKHMLALFPLVTCLLCVSQKTFFLTNWHYFLVMCLSHLKNRDPKMSRVALESLYRLLWVYMIRIKCESNSATTSRLQSIVNSLFPKGSKAVVPRDTPLNIFVKIIQFIAQERLDFAMKDIVFDLLSVGRPLKPVLTPERMSIGLRAFLVVADGLEQKEGDPPMPRTVGVLPSGNTVRHKKTFINKMLTEEVARNIGMNQYYPHVKKVLTDILRALDSQVGRPLMMTTTHNINKEPDDMITGERKPKIDLFRTCIAAIPRLIPEGMSRSDLIDLLSRLTLHMDEELRVLSFQALQNLIHDFPDWRDDILHDFVHFLLTEISDCFPSLLDSGLRMLLQLLTHWKNVIQSGSATSDANRNITPTSCSSTPTGTKGPIGSRANNSRNDTIKEGAITDVASPITVMSSQVSRDKTLLVLHHIEAFALVMLCNGRQQGRRVCAQLLKEVKQAMMLLPPCSSGRKVKAVVQVMDGCAATVVDGCLSTIPSSDRATITTSLNNVDLQWLVDRTGSCWTSNGNGDIDSLNGSGSDSRTTSQDLLRDEFRLNAWTNCLMGLIPQVGRQCPTASRFAWNIVCHRMNTVFSHLESASAMLTDRASVLLRGNSSLPKRSPTLRNAYLSLWRSYLMFACRLSPSVYHLESRPDLDASSSPESDAIHRSHHTHSSHQLSQHNSLLHPHTHSHSLMDSVNKSGSMTGSFLSASNAAFTPLSSNPGTQTGSNMMTSVSTPSSCCCGGPNWKSPSPASLFGQMIPLLRSEQHELRASVILGLSFVNDVALRDLIEELGSIIRETTEIRKQENMRRKKRRDLLRSQVSHLMELIAMRGAFHNNGYLIDRDTGSLLPNIIDFMDGNRICLEADLDKDLGSHIFETKQTLCNFVVHLCDSFKSEDRGNLMGRDLRKNLFSIFTSWSGGYGKYLSKRIPLPEDLNPSQMEISALKAMCAVLSAGPIFNHNLLAEDSSLFTWLEALLSSRDDKLSSLAQNTLILLLDFNPDIGSLLDWVVDACYTKPVEVADPCFLSMATVFCLREYPCDHYISIINLTLTQIGCPRIRIHQTAVELLQVLDIRFFDTNSKDVFDSTLDASSNPQTGPRKLFVNQSMSHDGDKNIKKEFCPLLSNKGPWTQPQTSERMSLLHPHLTMPIFSEVTFRFQTARPAVCKTLLDNLIPWLDNHIELVDPHLMGSMSMTMSSSSLPFSEKQKRLNKRPTGFGVGPGPAPGSVPPGSGWGSSEATEMILNNLLYITAKFGDAFPNEVERVWSALCITFPNNVKIIIRYLFIMTAIAPVHLLSFTKRVTTFIARRNPNRLLDEIMTQLQSVESLNCLIERTETPPFYRLTTLRKPNSHSEDDCASEATTTAEGGKSTVINLEEGTLHTKRHSTEGGTGPGASSSISQSQGIRESSSVTGCGVHAMDASIRRSRIGESLMEDSSLGAEDSFDSDNDNDLSPCHRDNDLGSLTLQLTIPNLEGKGPTTPNPHPPPMPEFGGFYAPLSAYLPATSQPVVLVHRCNLAVILLSDVVIGHNEIDWTHHLPIMLHIILLGLDHSRPFVSSHCKQLLLNLCLTCVNYQDQPTTTRILINNQNASLNPFNSLPRIKTKNFTEPEETSGIRRHQPTTAFVTPNQESQRGQACRSSSIKLDRPNHFRENVRKGVPSLAQMGLGLGLDAGEGDDLDEMQKTPEEQDREGPSLNQQLGSPQDLLQSMIHFISGNRSETLWSCEDITAKVWSIQSEEQLCYFLHHILVVFKVAYPSCGLEDRWSDIALQLALSCSSRHYAGRSLQIFRALNMPLNSRTISDILSRLIETVSEQGEDMQGYVTELMLTLESSVNAIGSQPNSLSFLLSRILESDPTPSTPTLLLPPYQSHNTNLGVNPPTPSKSAPPPQLQNVSPIPALVAVVSPRSRASSSPCNSPNISVSRNSTPTLTPTTCISPTIPLVGDKISDSRTGTPTSENRSITPTTNGPAPVKQSARTSSVSGSQSGGFSIEIGEKGEGESDQGWAPPIIKKMGTRSKSVQSLRSLEDSFLNPEDKDILLSKLFWISVAMLETDYEHEFLLAVRLLHKVLDKLHLERDDSREKVDKILLQLKWPSFPGLHSLLLKGCTSSSTYDSTVQLLHKLTPLLEIGIVDPTSTSDAFPFNVMAILPVIISNYDHPTPLCLQAAESIAQWCEKSQKLENLATVMTLYNRRSFSKESFQFTKCVVKYLYDGFSHLFLNLITFLVEMTDKGPSYISSHTLTIIYCILHYVDVDGSSSSMNSDLCKLMDKYMEGSQWKEALKIIKLVVSRSSSLAAAPTFPGSGYSAFGSINFGSTYITSTAADCMSITSGTSFADSDFTRRELPGRTMDFTFDLTQTPIVGRKHIVDKGTVNTNVVDGPSGSNASETWEIAGSGHVTCPVVSGSVSPKKTLSHHASFNEHGNWKRPWLSQGRTRERLICLLTSFGQRVGLPKSPSVIFSQTSDVVDRQSSVASSTEDISAGNNEVSVESKGEEAAATDFGVYSGRDFDFLEYELESQDSEGMDNFNWGVRRRSLSNLEDPIEDIFSNSPLHEPNEPSDLSSSQHQPREMDASESDEEIGSVSPFEVRTKGQADRPMSVLSCSSTHSEGDLTLSNTSLSVSPPRDP